MPEPRKGGVRILIVDDHALFRESVARLLSAEGEFAVSHCGSVEEAFRALVSQPADIVLLDYDLGRENGLEFLREARGRGFKGKVLIVTAGVDKRRAAELIEAGVAGVFVKHNSASSLARAIRDVMAGQVWFDQELLQGVWRAEGSATPSPSRRLTDRERQVLSCVFEGLANKQIAGRLGVSESSVKSTLQQLFGKTGVRTRSQLVRVALELYRDEVLSSP